MSVNHRLQAVCLASAFAFLSSSSRADDEGFAINRFEPAERGSDWFTQDAINIEGHPRLAAGLTLDWAHEPLVLYDENGDEAAAIVEDQVFAHLGASINLLERLRLGFTMPVALYSGGDAGQLNGTTFDAAQGAAAGDLRLGADYRIYGKYRSPLSVAAGAWVWLPTGSQDAFTGDGKMRFSPHASVAGDISMFAYAARLAFDYRAQKQSFGEAEVGSDLTFGASAGVRLMDKKLLLGPEFTLTSGVADKFFSRATTPFELLFGAHYEFLRDFRVGAGFGPGLSRGIGTPEYRGVLSFDWVQHVEKKVVPVQPRPSDRDGDGIFDDDDACPDAAGLKTADPETNGCPDSDGDKIIDKLDACVSESGIASTDPKKNGCPPPKDRDRDGVLDVEDACPDEAGVATSDPATNGCAPPKDTDSDTVMDPEDACPVVKGKPSKDPKKNGCPAARVEKGQIRIIERVEFDTGSSKIQAGSDEVLLAVHEVLKTLPEGTKLNIEGHTDDRGDDVSNKDLSRRRAEAVKKWLIARGVAAKLLGSVGYGEERPLGTNETEEGRQNNRRVEFHIVEVDGKPVTQGESR